jgi:DNA-binding MarR family transcriptional regulator
MQLMPDRKPAAGKMARRIADECLALRVRRLDRLVTRVFDDALRPHGVSAAQLNLLVGITVAGPVRAAELGRALDLDKSTVSRNLALLQASGWITGARDLELTTEGAAVLERAFPAWRRAQESLTEWLGERAAGTLEGMLRKMQPAREGARHEET